MLRVHEWVQSWWVFLEKSNLYDFEITEYLPETVDSISLYQNHKEINSDPPCCITLLSLTLFPTIYQWHAHIHARMRSSLIV